MRRLFNDARFSDAAALYDAQKSPAQTSFDARLLRARIFFKSLDYPAAIALLSSAPKKLNSQNEAERLMLLGVAHARTSQFAEADEYFARASRIGADKYFPTELPYLRGRRFLEQGKPKNALTELDRLRTINSEDARIFGDLLEAGVLSEQERYREQGSLLAALIRRLDDATQPRIEERAHALGMLAMLTRELDDATLREFVEANLGRQTWTDDLKVQEFQTLKAVGWGRALQGDYFNGLRHLKMAAGVATSPAWRAMALLDRAYLARCFGEARWSREELQEADELLTQVRWRDTRDEERVALLLAAELFASIDAAKSASYLAQFAELREAMSPLILSRYDRRLLALADYANAIVDLHFGNRKAATKNLQDAWKVYDEIGFNWRAGRTALKLYKITQEKRWLERAELKLANYKASWLWNELRRADPQDRALPRLTRSQRRVLELICEGKTSAQICNETGRSIYTIQNHVNRILNAFGVPNRAALVAEMAKREAIHS